MKKARLFFLVLVMLGSLGVRESGAVEWCWEISTTDYFRLSVTQPDPTLPYWSLNGIWYEPSTNTVIPLTGTMVKNYNGTQLLLNFSGTLYGTTVLQEAYQMEAVIAPATRNGTLYIYYPISSENFSFPFNKVKCSSTPAP